MTKEESTTMKATLKHLQRNPQMCFSSGSIALALNIPNSTARSNLHRLFLDKKITKTERGHYRAMSKPEDIQKRLWHAIYELKSIGKTVQEMVEEQESFLE